MLEELVLAPGVGKVPRSLVLGCAGFCSLRLVPNQLGVSKVRRKGTGLRPAPKALSAHMGQGLLVWQGEGIRCAGMSYPVLCRWTKSCGGGYLPRQA